MPKIVILEGELSYGSWDNEFIINDATPWEEVSEEEYAFLDKHCSSANFRVIKQISIEQAKLSVKSILAELKNKIRINEERESKRKREAAQKAALLKEKKKQKEIEKAKQLLTKEGILKNDPKYDSNGQPL